MNRMVISCFVFLFVIGSLGFAVDEEYTSDQLLVKFAKINGSSLSLAQRTSVLNGCLPGCAIEKNFKLVPDLTVVKLPDGVIVEKAITKLSQSPLIDYAEPNFKRRIMARNVPNDANFPYQWNMDNWGPPYGDSPIPPDGFKLADINAPEAWSIWPGVRNIIVAVIDTGVDYNHPDLRDNMWVNTLERDGTPGVDDDLNGYIDDIYGWDAAGDSFTNRWDFDGDPCDSVFHGTHVAGIIGAVGNNGIGVAGVCWYTRIMAVKIFANDYTDSTTDSLAIAGIEYAVFNGANIINASWGGYGYSNGLHDAIAAAGAYGILFVAAAGNEGNDNDVYPFYPASYDDLDNIISVAATDSYDDLVRGPYWYSNYGAESVDLGAPGDPIFSTTPTYETNDMNRLIPGYGRQIVDVNYDWLSGTSMAAPHVAGAAAFIWSFKPMMDYKFIKEAILSTAQVPIYKDYWGYNPLEGKCVTGGRLCLDELIDKVNGLVIRLSDVSHYYPSIQSCINDATYNDTVIASYGHWYFESINFLGKRALKVQSGDITNPWVPDEHPENTLIIPLGLGQRAVTISYPPGTDSLGAALRGFTITEGVADNPTGYGSYGGGILLDNASPLISNCIITDNYAVADGGGIDCEDQSNPTIQDCTINNNTAMEYGGGLFSYESSPVIKNCLIFDNIVASDGGAIYLFDRSNTRQPQVSNCTIVNNTEQDTLRGLGGGVYCYWNQPTIKDSIFAQNAGYAIYEENVSSDPTLSYCLFFNNPDGDYYDADTLHVYTGAAAINGIPDGKASHNISGDPCFATGRLGDFYLGCVAAGQLANSIAFDKGSTTATAAGLNNYTTRTDNVKDTGIVDIGFHYKDATLPKTFTLTTYVYPEGRGTIVPAPGSYPYQQYTVVPLVASVVDPSDPNYPYQFKAWHGTDDDTKKEVIPANGVVKLIQNNVVTMTSNKNVIAEFENRFVTLRITVTSYNGTVTVSPPPDLGGPRMKYKRGTVVTLTAHPDNPSNRAQWTGTDDDTNTTLVNTVTMTTDRTITVEFYAPRTLIVAGGGVPGAYTELDVALSEARDGDVIVVHDGVWHPTRPDGMFAIDGKAITLRSQNPDDPCVVARTVLGGGWNVTAPLLSIDNVNRDTVIAGITFRDYTHFEGLAVDCTVQDCNGDGGYGASAYGGGLQIGFRSQVLGMSSDLILNSFFQASPTIVNCVFDNLSLYGGDGQDNVAACPNINADGGWGGRAYGAGVYIGPGCKPLFKNVTFRDCNAIGGDGGNGCVHGGSWGNPNPNYALDGWYWYWGPFDEPWKYTGMGGAAYCDVSSAPEFIDCLFQGNHVQGGSSGLPLNAGWAHWRIDSYGGAVYCAAESAPKFTGCTFIGNTADVNGFRRLWRWKPVPPINDPIQIADKYFAFGGAVAIEGEATTFEGFPVHYGQSRPVFENCKFEDNYTPNGNGGAMHIQHGFNGDSKTVIDKSTFTDNNSLQGGAIYAVNGTIELYESTFTGNRATSDVGEGGAIFIIDANALISDSNITGNSATASGGGVFTSSSKGLLWNCMIKDNFSGRDGGGLSANLYSDINVVNCTITNNAGGKFGGGIYCAYNSFVNVLDSIIWGNFATNGHQIAIASDDPYFAEPSVVNVSHSLVGPAHALSVFGLEEQSSQQGSSSTQLIESQTIQTELNGSGWAKVIVTLDEPVELKNQTDWDSSASVAILQAEITKRQQAVTSTLTSQEFQLRYQCKNVTTFSGRVTSSGLNKLISNPQIKFIEPVRYLYPAMKQGLNITNAMGIRPTYSGSGVAVAIVDTGVDYRHPKLGGGSFPNSKVIGGYDTGMMDADPIPVGVAHGTCCAGIAAGDLADVGDYIGGVAYNAKIYALKASPDNAGFFEVDAIVASWDWCVTHKNDNPLYPIVVISNSLGGGAYSTHEQADADYPAVANMASTAVAAGIVVTAASGNEGGTNTISVPAALSNVISVGAVYDTTDSVIWYSNSADILDILAPSDPTYTTDIIGSAGYSSGDYYPYFNGTSSACPFAAGSVAVLQSAAKQLLGKYLTPKQVRIALVASGDAVTDTKAPVTKPRVNVGEMINGLKAGPIYIETGSSIEHSWWNAASSTWNAASYNLAVTVDPCFAEGYYLSQGAAGEDANSLCVDAGHTDAFDAGMYRHTTRTDLVVEDFDSPVDTGYHYLRTTEFQGDYNFDGKVDPDVSIDDFTRWVRHWLYNDCAFPDWCDGTDLNKDGVVNNLDYAIWALNRGKVETTPPYPDPMTWEVFPKSQAGERWATMKATKAKDAYGGPIEYYFQALEANDTPRDVQYDSGWGKGERRRSFTDSNVDLYKEYGYRVKARDARGNETGWSVIGKVTIGKVSPPEAPSNLVASAVSTTQINLSWTDNSSDEINFELQRKTGSNSYTTIAKPGPNVISYHDTGLTGGLTYTYQIRAQNTGGDSPFSNEASATPPPPPPEPNKPVMRTGTLDPNCGQYYDANTGYWYHRVVATVPDLGGVPTVWFRFVCTSSGSFSSQWLNLANGTYYYTHPISASYPQVVVTVNGTIVTYTIAIKQGGYFGLSRNWQVCASYNSDGSYSNCSNIIAIPY